MYRKYKLNEKYTLYKSLCFPYISKKKPTFSHRVTIGIGGNLGDVKRRFEHLFVVLQKEKRVELVETSLILKNPPFGYMEQEDFFNSIIICYTEMNAKDFLYYLQRLEKKFGRKRSFKDAPRTLDLDMIFFDNITMQTDFLTLPHPSWHERESVLIPLAGIRS